MGLADTPFLSDPGGDVLWRGGDSSFPSKSQSGRVLVPDGGRDPHAQQGVSATVSLGNDCGVSPTAGTHRVSSICELIHQPWDFRPVLIDEPNGPMAAGKFDLASKPAVVGNNHRDATRHQLQKHAAASCFVSRRVIEKQPNVRGI
jgi:hypothetical protein